ncbi:4'-phosphopantetheinyl transferase family protein [Streptomyces sp. NPDC057136]|uniref:4'-phosphopantetheinyl transferase family protein n=1 Tax=Streptomyces sp. NPDC057136 TaxID=3346029 RepID=UPI003632D7A5
MTAGTPEVRVWFTRLCADPPGRMPQETKRRVRTATRRWVHATVARWLAVPPRALRWERDDGGKPFVVARGRTVHLSYSHSDGVAGLALSESAPVGLDVERVRERTHLEALAHGCLSATEFAQWRRLPERTGPEGFCRLWTRKEAVLKAWGSGVPALLDRVGTALGSDGAPGPEDAQGSGGSAAVRIVQLPAELGPAAGWTVHEVPAPRGHLAAVAVRAAGARVRMAGTLLSTTEHDHMERSFPDVAHR